MKIQNCLTFGSTSLKWSSTLILTNNPLLEGGRSDVFPKSENAHLETVVIDAKNKLATKMLWGLLYHQASCRTRVSIACGNLHREW